MPKSSRQASAAHERSHDMGEKSMDVRKIFKKERKVVIEIAIIGMIGICTFFVAAYFDTGEVLSEAFERYEHLELDEIFTTCMILIVCIGIFSFRRWRDLAREIVVRKQLEDELITKNEILEKTNRELNDFTSIASHDLQEPLRKIMTFSDLLTAKYSEFLEERVRDYLVRIKDAAERMQNLIDDLLNYSKVTRRSKPFEPVDLDAVIRNVTSILEVHIRETGGRVEASGQLTIEADPTQMCQLFQNLIGNALKFHRKDVAPVIKISKQLLKGEYIRSDGQLTSDGMVQITVEDNGIGFDQQYAGKLFQPFQRLHNRNEYEGTGMGLTICRKIVERHGGTIAAKSTPGGGSTFIITLPVRQNIP